MSQVVATTNDIITDSLSLIGELGDGEVPSGIMLSRGLMILNELLNKFTSDSIYIPYLTTLDFTLVPNQPTYTFSDMVPGADVVSNRIIDLVFGEYDVPTTAPTVLTYPLTIVNKATYYNITRQTILVGRPGIIFLNKQATESLVTFYPAPDQPYPCHLQVKVMLNKVEADEDLTSLPPYSYRFLKFALGRDFRSYYPSANWTDTAEQEYQECYANFKVSNETDLTIRPSMILNVEQPYYWANILALP